MDTLSKLTLPGVLFALTLVFGFWLSHLGKPYNGPLFNLHKLIALGGVVLFLVQLTKIPGLLTSSSLVAIGLVLAALAVVALFASGALMSAGKLDYALMLTVHRVAPGVLALGCALALYWLMRKP